jgi:ATP-binding cassette subfamily F protein uup
LAPIISARGLAKRFGVAPLFRSISFTVSEGERIGIIGPNGSGKSTLLAILQGGVAPDSGEVAIRKGIRLGSVLQISDFAEGATVRSVVTRALDDAHVPESDRAGRLARPRWNSVARRSLAKRLVRVRCGEPRPLFP